MGKELQHPVKTIYFMKITDSSIIIDNHYVTLYNIIMKQLLKPKNLFSGQKYFLDTHRKNLTALFFGHPDALSKICLIFAKHGVNLTYLRTHCESYEGESARYRLEVSLKTTDYSSFKKAENELKEAGVAIEQSPPVRLPWFPRNQKDIDQLDQTFSQCKQSSKDHPQFHDLQYRARRDYIAKVAKEYKVGTRIPDISYTKDETQLWKRIYTHLSALHKEAMCSQFLKASEELNSTFKLSQRIPQLNELSDYLKSKTGFTIKPTLGQLSQRQFLNAFAFKIFFSTQYLRNVKNPDYSPEPDIVHEIVGHIPMFADPVVAELSHRIGLLSLGAADQDIAKLGSLYWFTLEYGVCKQADRLKGYGSGIASSIGQINWFMGREKSKPKFQKLDIFKDCTSSYPTQTLQPVYKVTQSFADALKNLETYGRGLMKPVTTVFHKERNQIVYDRNIEAVGMQNNTPTFD